MFGTEINNASIHCHLNEDGKGGRQVIAEMLKRNLVKEPEEMVLYIPLNIFW
jgi:hypothetical protein